MYDGINTISGFVVTWDPFKSWILVSYELSDSRDFLFKMTYANFSVMDM